MFAKSIKIVTQRSKLNGKKTSKIIPNPPMTLPKPFQDGSKFDPEGLLESILAHPFSKLYFERPKNVQEAPKSADKAQLGSNLAPTWSQLGSIRGSKIETKNLQNRCWKTSPTLLRIPCAHSARSAAVQGVRIKARVKAKAQLLQQ